MAIVDIKHTQTIEELASKLGEGGSGGGGGTFIVTCTSEEIEGDTEWSVDKTLTEINTAYENGNVVLLALTGVVFYGETLPPILCNAVSIIPECAEFTSNTAGLATPIYYVRIEIDPEEGEYVVVTPILIGEAYVISENIHPLGNDEYILSRTAGELAELLGAGKAIMGVCYEGSGAFYTTLVYAQRAVNGDNPSQNDYTFVFRKGENLLAFMATGEDSRPATAEVS